MTPIEPVKQCDLCGAWRPKLHHVDYPNGGHDEQELCCDCVDTWLGVTCQCRDIPFVDPIIDEDGYDE